MYGAGPADGPVRASSPANGDFRRTTGGGSGDFGRGSRAPRPMPRPGRVPEADGMRNPTAVTGALRLTALLLVAQGLGGLAHRLTGRFALWTVVHRLPFLDGYEVYACVLLAVLSVALGAAGDSLARRRDSRGGGRERPDRPAGTGERPRTYERPRTNEGPWTNEGPRTNGGSWTNERPRTNGGSWTGERPATSERSSADERPRLDERR